MRGEFMGVWSETCREIWDVLAAQEAAPSDLFCELYFELSSALSAAPSAQQLADIIDNPIRSKEAFENITSAQLSGERGLATFFENAHAIFDDFGGDSLSNHYFNLLTMFIDKFSLRYDLRRPCTLCPTLPGVFASLVGDLRIVASRDAKLDSRLREFEEAVRDLRYGCSEGRIKTCIGKQFMLLEALGGALPGVTEKTLGAMCNEVNSWPHVTIRESLKKLYGFGSDFPGIRHGTDTDGARRVVDMRDLVAMCVLLTGFTPYLIDQFDAERMYHGA